MEDELGISDIQDILLVMRRSMVDYEIHIEKICPICKTPLEYIVHIDHLNSIAYPCGHTSKEIVEKFHLI